MENNNPLLQEIIFIGIGGSLGAIARYLLCRWIPKGEANFPTGTLLVNILGSFILSFLIYSLENGSKITPQVHIMLTTGMMGAFTTMSTFSYESFKFLETNRWDLVGLYLLLTISLVLAGTFLGKITANQLFPPNLNLE